MNRLRAFNRFELKYLVPVERIPELRDELRRRMDPDPHSPPGGYSVWSCYYDTTDLRFYWEKIEGLRFRRKLRVRHYGDPAAAGEDSPVQVEIKQRVNRVTQKRRIEVPYGAALRLCDDRRTIEHGPREAAFVREVLELVTRLGLRPVAMTGYQREALAGRDADTGLRVTFDRRVRGRDRDFHFAAPAENRFIVPPRLAVLEIKANERTPHWITDFAARRELSLVRVSKYCQSVEAHGRAPRSVFHVPEDHTVPCPTPDRERAATPR